MDPFWSTTWCMSESWFFHMWTAYHASEHVTRRLGLSILMRTILPAKTVFDLLTLIVNLLGFVIAEVLLAVWIPTSILLVSILSVWMLLTLKPRTAGWILGIVSLAWLASLFLLVVAPFVAITVNVARLVFFVVQWAWLLVIPEFSGPIYTSLNKMEQRIIRVWSHFKSRVERWSGVSETQTGV